MGALITEDNEHIKTNFVMASHKKYLERSLRLVSIQKNFNEYNF